MQLADYADVGAAFAVDRDHGLQPDPGNSFPTAEFTPGLDGSGVVV